MHETDAVARDILPGVPRDQQSLRLPHLVYALLLPVVHFQEDPPHGRPRLPLLREDAERLLQIITTSQRQGYNTV